MKKFLTAIILLFPVLSIAQNIAITDDNGYSPHASAMLDVKSTTKGMLVPRLTSSQRTAISNATQGLLVFDTDSVCFYFHDGSDWVNLTSANANDIWSKSASSVFLSDTTHKLGVGTLAPNGKFIVQADNSIGIDDPLFEVKDKAGNTVFAVHNDGARVYVDESTKGSIGGFAVSGRTSSKGVKDYMWVTKDSVRIYLEDAGKGIGGFAVSGRTSSKGAYDEFLRVTPDSTRVYVRETAKGNIGGFAVSGRTSSKGTEHKYLSVTPDSTRVYINNNGAKGNIGGFAVSGRTSSKGLINEYFNVDLDTNQIINPSEPRILWYPTKEAFMTGRVLVEDPDSVGTNSFASGFESKAVGNWSQALGYHARAYGDYSTAIGVNAQAIGENSFAFGDSVYATGRWSFAFGTRGRDMDGNLTDGVTTATGDFSYAFGNGDSATNNGAIAIGTGNVSSGRYAITMGYENVASNMNTTCIGVQNISDNIVSTAIGWRNVSSGAFSIAMGNESQATWQNAVAIGNNSYATSYGSVAIGDTARATSMFSLAMGRLTISSGRASVAMGEDTEASGDAATAFGYGTTAAGDYSTAFGRYTSASGLNSTAFGRDMYVVGNYSMGISLNDPSGFGYIMTQPNTLAIMGGTVGINTLTPSTSYKLDVAGAINIKKGSTGGALYVNGSEAIWYNGTYYSWGYGGYDNYFADYVGLGVTNPLYRLQLSTNSAAKPSSSTWTIYSDERLKEIKGSYTKGLEEIIQLKPIVYNYKENKSLGISKSDKASYGLVAQEVQKIFPEAVSNNPDSGYLDLDMHSINVAMINAIKELKEENDLLRKELEEIKTLLLNK